MKNLFIAAFLTISYNMIAQTIQCPAAQTVHFFDLDQDYTSYGSPTFSGPGTYELDTHFTIVENLCQGSYGIVTTITYSLIDQSTNQSVASCQQTISVLRPEDEDYTFPQKFVIGEGAISEMTPDVTGQIEPIEFLNDGGFIHVVSYSDEIQTFDAGGVIINRTWTMLNWCTAETTEQTQPIQILRLLSAGSGPLDVSSCTNETVEADNVIVTTDAAGFTIDYGTCPNTTNNITDFVNCVAANNDIPSTNNFIVEVVKEGDDLNGVSTVDLVITQRHILGIAPFDNNDECKNIAADVNNDNAITALDLLTTRKLILGIFSNLPQSTSWRFINAGYTAQPLSLADDDFKFRKLEFPISDLQVIGVKIGDVNDSAVGN